MSSIAGAWKELLLVVLYVLWYLKSKSGQIQTKTTTRLHWMILLSFLAAVLSILVNYIMRGAASYDLDFSRWITVHESAKIAIAGLRTLLESSLYFFVLLALIDDEETLLEMANLFILCGVLIAIYGIYQHYYVKTPASWVYANKEGGATRSFSMLNNPNDLGSFMLMTTPLALSFALYTKDKRDRIIYGIASLILLICLIFTLSRGAWIGFMCGILLYVLVTRNWKLLIALIIVVGGIAVFVPSIADRLLLVFSQSYLQKAQTAGRLAFWPRALMIWTKRPITGAGLGLVGDSVAVNMNVPGATWIDNQYIKVLAETGILGIVTYVGMLLTPILRAWQWMSDSANKRTFPYVLNAGILVGVFGIIVENFFEGTLETWVISTYFWTLIGMLYAGIKISKRSGQK